MTPIEQFFYDIEHTGLSLWVRGESMFAFPLILVVHTLGMAFLAGVGAVIALRILGFAPNVPLRALERFYPVLWLGLALNAASGVLLLIGYPYKAATNPVFYVKLTCIAFGIFLSVKIRSEVLRAPVAAGPSLGVTMPRHAVVLAVLLLVSWVATILAGRLLAYTYVWLHVGFRGGF